MDILDIIHQLFINTAPNVNKVRILQEIKKWFKKLIIGREMAKQYRDLIFPDTWNMQCILDTLTDIRVRLLYQD